MTGAEEMNGVQEGSLKSLSNLLPRGGVPKQISFIVTPDSRSLYDDYKAGKDCDVVIRVDHNTVAAHSQVLNKCPYFAGELVLHSKKGDKIYLDIHGVSFEALTRVVEYLYGDEIAVDADNVQGFYEVATKLQLNDLYQVCFDFIKNLICSSNAIPIYRLAEKEGWDELKEIAWDNCLRHFMHVIQSVGFLEAPKEIVLGLLSQDRLCLNQGGGMTPEAHEKAILDAVLRYTEIQGTEEEFLVKMLKAVRLPLISKSDLVELQMKFNTEGHWAAAEIVQQAVVVNRHMSVPSINLSDLKWKRPRTAASKLTMFLQYPGYLHGETFSDNWTDPWIHVVGLKIWVKPSMYFQNKRVVCGLKVYYSNGEAVEHGSRDEENSSQYSFQLGEEERIVQVEKCRSCNSLNGILYNLINKLTFMTNKGHVYGVYVNPSKEPDIFSAPSGVQYVHLAGIKGTYAEVEEEKYIDWLAFNWAFC